MIYLNEQYMYIYLLKLTVIISSLFIKLNRANYKINLIYIKKFEKKYFNTNKNKKLRLFLYINYSSFL